MAIGPVGICNLALARIGTKSTIVSLDEASPEARQCKLLFPHSRDASLRAFPWGFARRERALSILSDEESEGWGFVYAYPSDCLRVLYIKPAVRGTKRGPIVTGLSADGDRRTIQSDTENAVLVYIARVTDTTLFDPLFVEAMSYKLGAELAPGLGISEQRQQQALRMFQSAIMAAQAADANESPPLDRPDPDWITGR